MKNFNEIFRKDGTYDNIKRHEKQGFTLSLEDAFSKKHTGEGGFKFTPSRFRLDLSTQKTSRRWYLKSKHYTSVRILDNQDIVKNTNDKTEICNHIYYFFNYLYTETLSFPSNNLETYLNTISFQKLAKEKGKIVE